MLDLPSAYHKEDLHLVPFTYCFSPTLVPRPSDWPRDLIDIVGFFSLDGSKSNYKPNLELVEFLAQEDKPVYFGFGSLVVEKPQVQYLMHAPSALSMHTTMILAGYAASGRRHCHFGNGRS